jgi:hypothetical protein
MATRMWSAAYAGVAKAPAELRLRAAGRDASPVRGLLCAVDGAGGLHQVAPVAGAGSEWRLTVDTGPSLTFQSPMGPVTLDPTHPATVERPAGFRLGLIAAAGDPKGPVLVSLERHGDLLTAVGPNDAGGVVADTVIEAAGNAFDLYLEA